MKRNLVPFRRLVLFVAALAVAGCLGPGMAAAAPAEPSPTSLSFGQETVGKVSTAKIAEIANPEPGAVQVVGVALVGADPGDFAVVGGSCAGTTLLQGEGCAVEVAFAPQAGGARSAALEVAVEGEAALEVPLSGTGQTMRLTVPASTAFPTLTVGGASTEKVALKNSSEAGVNVSEVRIEGTDPGDFGIEGGNCVGYIGPGMGCELNVRFAPGASGPREALLRVVTDGTPAEVTTELSGEGAAPELTFEPGEHDFGLSEAHSGGTRTNFTVRNTGAAAVQLSNLEITGPDAREFWIPGSGCWGTALAPGATCGIEVQFNANEEGSFEAGLAITAGNATFQAPLTARAERPRVEASPAPFAIGPTPVGTVRTREVTLTNTGNLPVAFYIALVSGGDVGSFHIVRENCTSNVFAGNPRVFGPGESCVAKVAFAPTEVGAKAATLSFFGGGEGALQVPVEGTATAPRPTSAPDTGEGGAPVAGTSPGIATTTSASGGSRHGRVALSLRSRPRLTRAEATIGRARCESSKACVVRVSGLVTGRLATAARPAVRGVPVALLRLAPGESAPIGAALPPEFRGAGAGSTLRVVLQWQTGPERGAAARAFRLG